MLQVVGAHQRAGDLEVNVCKKKAVTNMRASGTDNKTPLTEAIRMSLDEALEYIVDDELVEVTPGQRAHPQGPQAEADARPEEVSVLGEKSDPGEKAPKQRRMQKK